MVLSVGSEVYGAAKTRYRVVGRIDQGAFSELYKIVSEDDGQAYTLKTVSALPPQDDELDALANEGRIATLIDHSNVIRVYHFHDGYEHPGLSPYLIMEHADGGSLQDILENQRRAGVQFGIDRLYNMLAELAGAMKAVNEVLIHGDIKPDNILIHDGRLKISDFGISCLIGEAGLAGGEDFAGGAAGEAAGARVLQHVRYMAPEIWQHRGRTIQADMYSMGIVFYELATLEHPYEAGSPGHPVDSWREAHLHATAALPERLNPELPPGIARVIESMLAKRPEARPASWSEIIEYLK
jgi:serine/threonine protein kinase